MNTNKITPEKSNMNEYFCNLNQKELELVSLRLKDYKKN